MIEPSTVFLITRNAGGSWESLDDVSTTAEGDSVVVTGTTRHFSPFASGNSAPGADAASAVNDSGGASAATEGSGSEDSGSASGGSGASTATATADGPTSGCFFTASGDLGQGVQSLEINDWTVCGVTFIEPSMSVTLLRPGTAIGVQVPQFDGATGTYDALLNIQSSDPTVLFIGECPLTVTLWQPDPSGANYDVEGRFDDCSSAFGTGSIDASFSTVE